MPNVCSEKTVCDIQIDRFLQVSGIHYHSALGWDMQKRLTELKLRRQLGKQRDKINWFLNKAITTDNILYYPILSRLLEIENEASESRIIHERDTFNPFTCDRCNDVNICDECFVNLNIGGTIND